MKATFQIPDELYREFKAESAREGRTVREVAISLFEQWLRQKKGPQAPASVVDWDGFQPPLAAHVVAGPGADGLEVMRGSIARNWDEPS